MHKTTPQWKKVLQDCNVKVIHSLSSQAKGKMERPYKKDANDQVSRIGVFPSKTSTEISRTNKKTEGPGKWLKIQIHEINRLEKASHGKGVKSTYMVICLQKFNTFGNSLCSLLQLQIMGEQF